MCSYEAVESIMRQMRVCKQAQKCKYLVDGEQSGDEAGGGREAHDHQPVAVRVSDGDAAETPQETPGGDIDEGRFWKADLW